MHTIKIKSTPWDLIEPDWVFVCLTRTEDDRSFFGFAYVISSRKISATCEVCICESTEYQSTSFIFWGLLWQNKWDISGLTAVSKDRFSIKCISCVLVMLTSYLWPAAPSRIIRLRSKACSDTHSPILCLYNCHFWWAIWGRYRAKWRYGSGGKSSRLAVGGLPVRSHPGCVEVSLSETPNPRSLLTSWLVPCMAANRRWCVNVWMRGIDCTAFWIKVLYKCSPFTIYHGDNWTEFDWCNP